MTGARIIDGKAIAARLRENTTFSVSSLAARGTIPGLAVVMIGNDPASEIYVSHKIKACATTGILSFEHRLPATATQTDAEYIIHRLNADPDIHGILLQLPVPPQINAGTLIELIAPEKDVDGLHPLNVGRLVAGLPGMIPCTPQGAMLLIREVCKNLSGLHAVIIGRSLLFGKPMAQLLLAENCTVTQAHSKTRDLPTLCAQADILVVAVGRAEMVKGHWIKPGAIVIDVGINRSPDEKLKGDVAFAEAINIASAITPVPGGVGPMTIACLLENTVYAASHKLT